MLIWSFPLIGSAIFSVYSPLHIGAAGWCATAVLWQFSTLPDLKRLAAPRTVLLLAFAIAYFVLSASFSYESIFTGRDQSVYANHAMHLTDKGKLHVDYPVDLSHNNLIRIVGQGYSSTGLARTPDNLRVIFSPLLPLWMAQSNATFGSAGIYSTNAFIAAISILLFYGICCLLMPHWLSLVAAIFFAINPMQLWIARITLSEPIAQFFILSAILLNAYGMILHNSRAQVAAGLLLGFSFFARIDGFLLCPILVAMIPIFEAFKPKHSDDNSPVRSPSLFVGSAIAMLFVGIGFYMLTSPAYFGDLRSKILFIFLAAVGIGLLYGLCRALNLFPALSKLLQHSTTWTILAIGIFLALAYAYFIRPHLEPFSTYSDPNFPLFGKRDYRENSLVNLGIYLSPLIVFLAPVGVYLALKRILIARCDQFLLPLVAIWLGYSLLYLYNPNISSDHFWATRRFVPVVLPGFILFAFIAIEQLVIRRFSRNWRTISTVLAAAILFSFCFHSTKHFLFLREYSGVTQFVDDIAEQLPEEDLVICDVSTRLFAPLALAYGKSILRLDLSVPEKLAAAEQVIRENVKADREYHLLLDHDRSVFLGNPFEDHNVDFQSRHIKRTVAALPREIEEMKYSVNLFKWRGPLSQSVIDYFESGSNSFQGLYSPERIQSADTRWTNGSASIMITGSKDQQPRAINLDILSFKPGTCRLEILANEELIFRATLETRPIKISVPLPKSIFNEGINLRIVSDTFVPKELGLGSDKRRLGIHLRNLEVSYSDP